MDLIPLFTRILVKRKEMERTAGGLYIPETTKELQATEGEVVAVGENVKTVIEGDIVFFGKYSGAEIERCGSKYVLMNEGDVLCRVKPVINA